MPNSALIIFEGPQKIARYLSRNNLKRKNLLIAGACYMS